MFPSKNLAEVALPIGLRVPGFPAAHPHPKIPRVPPNHKKMQKPWTKILLVVNVGSLNKKRDLKY